MSFENNKPHVNFEINKEMDYWTVGEFLSFNPSDSISNSILLGYPGLKKAKHLNNDERITYYKNYIDHIYNDQELKIADIRKKTQKSWNKVEKKFLDNAAKLFNGHPWPEGAYVGFLSIFNCGPRFLNEKIFQVYYKHKEGLVYACAHEMMHFMFYDYLEKNLDLSRNISDSVIWDLSEIFNIVVLERPEFVEITGNPHPRPYEKHETQISKFRKLMKRSKNIDDMIKESFRLLVQ
ncbi:MAG TPA: hypothetical protein PLW49_00350 [bacterium]|jgi:hypothetical protein|nr:hypothetical protein [bacterium]